MSLMEFSRGMNYIAEKEVVNEGNEYEVLKKFDKAYTEWVDSLGGERFGEVKTVITLDGINYPIFAYFSKDGEPQGFELAVSPVHLESEESANGKNFYRLSVSATIRTDIFVEAEDQYEAERKVKQGNFKGYFETPDHLIVNSILDTDFDEDLPDEAVKTWEYRPSSDRVS